MGEGISKHMAEFDPRAIMQIATGLSNAPANLGLSRRSFDVSKYKNIPNTVQSSVSAPQQFTQLGKITTGFGEPTRYETRHAGVDIAAPAGTAIPAFAGGTVREVVSGKVHGQPGFGNYAIIEDEYGNKHRYSHLSQAWVKVGQQVAAGQKIGTEGASGSTYSPSGSGQGAHLDYRIVDAYNRIVNPYTFYKKKV